MAQMDWDDLNLLIDDQTVKKLNLIDEYESNRKFADQIQNKADASRRIQKLIFRANKREDEIFLLIWNESETSRPLFVFSFERDFVWQLNRDPENWRFAPNPVIVSPPVSSSSWGILDFIQEIAVFPPVPTMERDSNLYLRLIGGHYILLSIWLRFYEMCSGSDKDTFRNLLYTDLLVGKPYADLSRARREFAQQLYPRSELAQRAESEDHLWFCIEYSSCLYRQNLPIQGKAATRNKNTSSIKAYKEALNKAKRGDYVETLSIENLFEQGEDWRLYIEDLLVNEAIRLVADEEGDSKNDLYYHCKRFLDAWSHFNGVTGQASSHVVLRAHASGEVFESCKGRKIKANVPEPRNRGRPIKGSKGT